MCLRAFARCSTVARTGRVNQSSPHDETKQPLLPKCMYLTGLTKVWARLTQCSCTHYKQLSPVEQESKEGGIHAHSARHRATMGTLDFDYEMASTCSSSISLLAGTGSSACDLSVNDVSLPQSNKQTTTSHLRNVSNTAVFGDEISESFGKERNPWIFAYSEPDSSSVFTYFDSTRSLLNTSTATAASRVMTASSSDITAPDCTSRADKVHDARVPINRPSTTVDYNSTHITSNTHASDHKMKTAEDLNKKACNVTFPPDAINPSTGSPLMFNTTPCTSQAGGTPTAPSRAKQSGQQHKCCLGVLSAFEAKFLNDEDKQAIIEGGCHGLCAAQATFINNKFSNDEETDAGSPKSSPPARCPSDRPARFVSSMPSDIMPNGRRGEGSTMPRFSRRRVAAEYKRPRSSLALAEHPSRKSGRPRGILLTQPDALRQTDRTFLRNAVQHSKSSISTDDKLNDLSSVSLDHLFSITHQPKQKLKRQVKHDDLRHEFESQGELAKGAHVTVQAREESSLRRKLFRRLRALF
ncbi:hypothetical protein KCU64_g14, partial [Aureobasidium melanogenum]